MAMRVLFRSTASRAGRSRSAAAHAVLPSSCQCQWALASSASSSSPLAQTLPSPRFFSSTSSSPSTLDEETEKKAGWMLKLLAAGTFTYVGLNVFPLMGDSLVKHSVALLRTKDPLFRRSGASRLTLIATGDERRLKIVDAGGIGALVNMLESASDDDTRREAVKALATLSECDAAVEALHKTGVQPFVNTLSTSSPDLETQQHTSFLLERLEQWRTKTSS